MEPSTFQPRLKKLKNTPQEKFLYFRKQKPQKTGYIFSKNAVLIFLKTGTQRKSLYFRKRKLPKKSSYISGSNFQSSKNEKISFVPGNVTSLHQTSKNSYISGRKFKVPRLKTFLYFSYFF